MRVIGLMSGTSYDAVDVAAAEFDRDGDTLHLRPLGDVEFPHPSPLRRQIAAVLPPATIGMADVCRLDTVLGQTFADAAARGVEELCDGRVDLVVSHGQTVFHWVENGHARGTLQLGRPAWIAEAAGAPVLSDLRCADVARGGQGAPLVPIFDAMLLGGDDTQRAALNLGGIANVTVTSDDGTVFGYDVGPANALVDAACERMAGVAYDRRGRLAASGRVVPELLQLLLDEPYYAQPPPKSTGKELFSWPYLKARLDRLDAVPDPVDVIATVTELTAVTVAAEVQRNDVGELVASGGGVRNLTLMRRLRELCGSSRTVSTIDDFGIPSGAKEAYAFALLGYLSWHGLAGAIPTVTG
ncbi:MAG: anhydro-N-acetylmuramic acid kinase, partial [Stackebrandtia sp.]